MNEQVTMDRLAAMRGETVYDSSGEKIGKVEEIFYDQITNQPEWIGIGTGFLGTTRVLVPVQGASATDEGVRVRYDKATVKDAPDIDGDEIGEDTERQLYSYYGIEPSTERSDSVLPGQEGFATQAYGSDASARPGDAGTESLTRSEEELRVGKRSVDAGRARLRKWVETEPVQADVELQRETVHVNREPVNEVVTGAEIGEQTIEVPLRDEEVVVEKQVVAKERVSLDTDVEQRTETVSDDVRKERVEVEGAERDLPGRER
jgi:uncharacterized protein (TIGR02271 family)